MEAYEVAARSALAFGCEVIPLHEDRLRASGMLTRPTDRRGDTIYDLNSDANASTEFAIARFFVPLLAHDGWCLFGECDMLFMEDPNALLSQVDESKAVMVVKHPPLELVGKKMDGRVQSGYPRKLWSSLCLWQPQHPANRRLNLMMLNQWPGRDLHRFGWLADDEIGELDPRWNHLVGVNAPRNDAAVIHWTLGCPNLPGYENCEHADLWRSVRSAA